MLIFKIDFVDPNLIDAPQANLIAHTLTEATEKRKFLMPFASGVSWVPDPTGITATYRGIGLTEVNPLGNFFMRELSQIIIDLNLNSIITVRSLSVKSLIGDKVPPVNFFKPSSTYNASLLTDFIKDEEIPEEYKCSMSTQLMDQAAYIGSKPEVKYNLAHIRYWIFTNDNLSDPLTRQKVELDEIKIDHDLTDRIKVFVNRSQKEGLEKRRAKFIEVMNNYGFNNITDETIEAAFRRAAAENNVAALAILERKVNNYDSQSSNGNTALHWAVEKECIETIEFLKSKKVSENIPNKAGMTALSLSQKSSNPRIKNLFETPKLNQDKLDELLGRKLRF